MDKALNYLALARKAGLAELGEEPVGAAARAQKARLIIVASDASDHTWRRAQSYVFQTGQQCIRMPFTKDALGQAIGRTELSLAAFTDPALALAFIQALNDPKKYGAVLEDLSNRTRRVRQHQREEKAHQRNKQTGRTRRGSGTKKN